jgi:hypothetical protein
MLIKSFFYNLYMLFQYILGKVKLYYREEEKSLSRVFLDFIAWFFREKEYNYHYFIFGLNRRDSDQKQYIGRKEFLKLKHRAERVLRKESGDIDLSYDVLIKDKFVAYSLFGSNNIPIVETIGLVNSSGIRFRDGKLAPLETLLKRQEPFVLKNVILEAGTGFLLCRPKGTTLLINNIELSMDDFRRRIGSCKWVMQPILKAHEAIRAVNSSALNTTRIVTVLDRERPVFLSGFQAFATGSMEIDSWSDGAIYVGLDYHGSCLRGNGFSHPSVTGKTISVAHPGSGILFDGYHVPFLREAVDICTRAHVYLYNSFIIGWDIAITDDGPLVLEANEKPGMSAVQCVGGGLRYKIHEYYLKIVRE